MKEANEKKLSIWIILLVGLLIILTCAATVYFTNKNNNDERDIMLQKISKEYFAEYLKIFGNLGDGWSIKNEDDLRQFWVLSYINNNTEVKEKQFADIEVNGEYDDYNNYIEISQKEVKEFMYKYFGIEYDIKEYKGELFYAIELSGENVIIHFKSIGYKTYDVEVTNVSYNGNNITVNLKMSLWAYDPSHIYEAKVSLEQNGDNYFIKDVSFFNSVFYEHES